MKTTILLIYAIAITVLFVIALVMIFRTRLKRDEKAAIEQKSLEIMVSQIKPHFIYNVLNTIYYLCEQDPARAQEAIEFFSEYLRENLDSFNANVPIPFVQELKHINNYIYLEKLRFGDDLTVEYDVKVKDFSVPALSVQPIVENAVKHGIRASEDGGTVKISTREDGVSYVIEVTDSGVGYDPHFKDKGNKKKDNSRSHVGISNTRERLSIMCGGTLDISTRVGVGTSVVIRIPKENKNRR